MRAHLPGKCFNGSWQPSSKIVVDLCGKVVSLKGVIPLLQLFVVKEMQPTKVLVALVDWHLISPTTEIVSYDARDAAFLYNAHG